MIRIETVSRLECVSIVREVILLLRDIGQEDLKSVIERDLVVGVFRHRLTTGGDNRVGALLITRLYWPQCGHLHVRTHVHMS